MHIITKEYVIFLEGLIASKVPVLETERVHGTPFHEPSLSRDFNPLTPRRTLVSPFTEISILFKKGSSKKFPMSVAPMSR